MSKVACFVSVLMLAMSGCTLPDASLQADGEPVDTPSKVRFEGQIIDLSEGWGEAHACLMAARTART
jgi:hypothetical protein